MLRSSPCAAKAEEEMQAVERPRMNAAWPGASPGGGRAASLMVFLDANPVIYLIEQPANLASRSRRGSPICWRAVSAWQ